MACTVVYNTAYIFYCRGIVSLHFLYVILYCNWLGISSMYTYNGRKCIREPEWNAGA